MEFRVANAVMAATPEWKEGKEPLPLALERAVEIGRETFLRQHPTVDDGLVRSINLHRVQGLHFGAKWYYWMMVAPVRNGEVEYLKTFEVIVLMDGTVVLPTK